MSLEEYIAWLRERLAEADARGFDETVTATVATLTLAQRPAFGRRVCSARGDAVYSFAFADLRAMLSRAERHAHARELAAGLGR